MLCLAPVPVVPGRVPRQQTLRQGALGESGWSDRDMLASVLLHRRLAQPCDLCKNQRRACGCCDRGPVHQPRHRGCQVYLPGGWAPVSPSGSEPFVMELWLAFLAARLPLHMVELTESLVPAFLTLGFLKSL